MTSKPRGKRNRNKRPLSLEERAKSALKELRAISYKIAQRQGADTHNNFSVNTIQIPVNIPLGDDSDGHVSKEASRIVGAIDTQLSTVLKSMVAFKPGHVYCFQCDDAACKHATPPNADDTFSGYTATGKPEWENYPNLCIARNEERVYRLWGDAPKIIAIVQKADELKEGLLPGFGRDNMFFNVLGQVVAGLVPVTVDPMDNKSDRVALTLQVIQTCTGKENDRLQLNVIGLTTVQIATAATQGGARSPAESLRRTLKSTRQKLRALSRRVTLAEKAGHKYDANPTVNGIVNRLKGDIERIFRPAGRRTNHAQHRHMSGERPTSQAMTDVRLASDDKVMRDTRHKTIVIIGKRGRAHVFTEEGRHVTSLKLTPREANRKTASGRWDKLSPKDAEAFKNKVTFPDE